MKVAVAGAGAIGSYLGAKLLKAGEDVSLIARGRHLEAMKSRGLRVIDLDGEFQVRPMATDDPSEIGQVDVVYLT
ncbi:MAG: oxidoreductase, partial [Chloroflexi bacterium]|nr:oxidoreductase [Chloroflexota bacterium]